MDKSCGFLAGSLAGNWGCLVPQNHPQHLTFTIDGTGIYAAPSIPFQSHPDRFGYASPIGGSCLGLRAVQFNFDMLVRNHENDSPSVGK